MFKTPKWKIEFLKKLQILQSGGFPTDWNKCDGLCINLFSIETRASEKRWLTTAFKVWPMFSGESEYPVPLKDESPPRAYFMREGRVDMYDRRTPYGKNRHELIDFLVKRLLSEGVICDES